MRLVCIGGAPAGLYPGASDEAPARFGITAVNRVTQYLSARGQQEANLARVAAAAQ
jgi:hypothetical protein